MVKEVKITDEFDTIEDQLDDNASLHYSGEVFNVKWTGNKAIDLGWMAEEENLAKYMDDGARKFYGERLKALVGVDEGSRAGWEVGARRGLELTDMFEQSGTQDDDLTDEDEDTREVMPRFPMVTQAVIEFAAQAGETLLSDPRPVKVSPPTVLGSENEAEKIAEADRLSDMLSWQVTVVDRNWKSDTDRLLHAVACIGTVFRKRWFDPVLGRNRSKFLSGFDVIVNHKATCLAEAPRVSERFFEYPHIIRQKIQSGEMYDVDLVSAGSGEDWHEPIEFLECHTWLDLDKDGADEPYIVCIQVSTGDVVSLRAGFTSSGFKVTEKGVLFEQIQQYADYHLIPSFDGSFYSKGFGHLVGRLSDTVDDLIASIVRTAKLNNSNGGVIGRVGTGLPENIALRSNELTVIPTDGQALQSQIVMFPTKDVSPTMFSVLGMLTDAGQKLTSTVNLMDGAAGNMPATTAMAIVEQGARVYSSILNRVWTAMGDEFTLLYNMNRATLKGGVAFEFNGKADTVQPAQFQPVRDVRVSADPRVSSAQHRALLSGYYAQFMGDPTTNQVELRKRMHELMRIPDAGALVNDEPPGIPPEVQAKVDEINSKVAEREIKAKLVSAQAANELLGALSTITELSPSLAGTEEMATKFASAYAILQKIAELGAKPNEQPIERPNGPKPPPMESGAGNAGVSGLLTPPPSGPAKPMGGGPI